MAKHRTHSIEFKRQVVQEFLGGESLHALATRHGIGRNLIKIWVAKFEAGGLDSDTAAADVLAEYEARIAALERLVGKLALENEFLKGVSRHVRQPKSASTSIVAGGWSLNRRRMPTDGADALNLLRRAAGPAHRRGTACRADQGGVRRVARLRLSSRDRRAAWRRQYREPQEGDAADEGKRPDRAAAAAGHYNDRQ